MVKTENRGTILVVDDSVRITSSIARALERHFEIVLTANTPEEAELHLRDHAVTHLLCDYVLGEGVPTGGELLPRWRAAHPGITRAVIFSGTDLSKIVVPQEADALVAKPVSVAEILDALKK